MFDRSYNLNCSFGFETKKTRYKPGEPVCVTFSQFATDTNYSFHVDADDVDIEYEDGKAIIRFTMPDHDVEVDYSCRNTMYRPIPGLGFLGFGGIDGEMKVVDDTKKKDEAPLQEGEWVCALCKARNFGKFCCECGSPKPKRDDGIASGGRTGHHPSQDDERCLLYEDGVRSAESATTGCY